MLGKDDTHRRFQSHMSHLGHQSKSEKVDRQTHGQRAGNEWDCETLVFPSILFPGHELRFFSQLCAPHHYDPPTTGSTATAPINHRSDSLKP